MRGARALLVIIGCVCVNGCLARQVTSDGVNLRQALIAMYTDQALDNLVRALENKPFVQLSYSQLSVLDQDKAIGTVPPSEAAFSGSKTVDLSKAVALQTVRGTGFAGKFPIGISGERDRTLSFHADPITDQNYIYDAYLQFAHNPALFCASDCRPKCPVHVVRRCGHRWYWVPTEAGHEFMQLVLTASLLPPQAPDQIYWDTSIATIEPRLNKGGTPITFKDKDDKVKGGKYVIMLAKDVPNDDGLMSVTLKGGKKVSLPIERVDFLPAAKEKEKAPMEGPAAGAPTRILYTQAPVTVIAPDRLMEYTGGQAQFYAESYPNLSPRPSGDAQKVQDALETLRLLLSKTNPTSP